MIRRILHGVGLATRGEVRIVEEKLATLRRRLEKTDARLAETAAAADRFERARHDDAKRHKASLAELEAAHKIRVAQAREAAARASQRIGALQTALAAREAELAAAAQQETLLDRRLAAALQDLQVTRASLAAVEVKLDILEGAANVLDSRTRPGRSQES